MNRSFVEFPWLLHLVLVGNDCRLQRGRHRRSGHSKHNQRQLPIEMATTTCSISKAIYTGRSVVDKNLGCFSLFCYTEPVRQHSMFGAHQPCESDPGTHQYSTASVTAFDLKLTGTDGVRGKKQCCGRRSLHWRLQRRFRCASTPLHNATGKYSLVSSSPQEALHAV